MEYTNEVLEKMEEKKSYNISYSKYYYRLHKDTKDEIYKKKSDRIGSCLNLWAWDVYKKNKLMDLKKVNRCMDNRFCPNCKKLDLAKCIHVFNPRFTSLIQEGYKPYLLTLTIPNCPGEQLEESINILNKMFSRFWRGMCEENQNSFKFRTFKFDAALKVLEITYSKKRGDYHPHFHCVVFSKSKINLKKNIIGLYSNKRKSENKHSLADIEIMKIWTMIFRKIRLTEKNFENMTINPKELLQCDIKEMNEKGIFEVLKYTFKDSDIVNYKVFKTLVLALKNKRIRQGYGLLYNLRTEDVDVGEEQSIEDFLEEKENPSNLLTREIKELITTYHEYRKISRFTSSEYMNIIE